MGAESRKETLRMKNEQSLVTLGKWMVGGGDHTDVTKVPGNTTKWNAMLFTRKKIEEEQALRLNTAREENEFRFGHSELEVPAVD